MMGRRPKPNEMVTEALPRSVCARIAREVPNTTELVRQVSTFVADGREKEARTRETIERAIATNLHPVEIASAWARIAKQAQTSIAAATIELLGRIRRKTRY